MRSILETLRRLSHGLDGHRQRFDGGQTFVVHVEFEVLDPEHLQSGHEGLDGLFTGLDGRACSRARVDELFAEAGVAFGRASNTALDNGITIVPVSVVKGLELDGVVVVEPSDIVEAEAQGMRSLYVALTRATQRLTVVHARPLPAPMIA